MMFFERVETVAMMSKILSEMKKYVVKWLHICAILN